MHNDTTTTSTAPLLVEDNTQEPSEQIDLGQIIDLLKQNKKTILKFALIPAVLTAIYTLVIPPTYTAEASFLPPNSMSSGASIIPAAAMLGQLAGGAALGALKDPTQVYIGVLSSNAVADDLIKQFDLAKIYKTKKLSETEKILKSSSKFASTKTSITTITVKDHDPKLAADLANAYLAELHHQSDRLAITEASQKRAFFQQQLEKEKDALADAEVAMAEIQQKTGLIQPAGQAQLQMQAITETQAEIKAREVQLAAISQGATEQNPEVVRIRSEIDGLRAQLAKLEDSSQRGQHRIGDIQVPTSKVPELSLVYLRKARDVKYHEELYQLLLRQFVSAELDESRSAPLVQVVDYARVPDSKSWPPRTLLTLVALILGSLTGVGWVVFRSRVTP